MTDIAPVAQISPLRAASTLLRYGPLIALLAVIAGGVAVVHSMLQPRTFTASGTFVPNASRSAPSFSGIAAQFGIAVQPTGNSQSPEFYTELIHTRTVLDTVAARAYPIPGAAGRTGTLAEALGQPRLQGRELRDQVGKVLGASISSKTGSVTVSATTQYPAVSATLAQNVIETVDQFNRRNERTQAAEERQFTEQRSEESKRQLDTADANLRDFLERNRLYQSSPQLLLEYEQLQRQQTLAGLLYSSLVQSYEQARIAEVRDRPQITVIERPEIPTVANSRGTVSRGLLGALLGAALGFAVMLTREYIDHSRRTNAAELAELSTLRGELVRSIRHPWRPIKRVDQPRDDTL